MNPAVIILAAVLLLIAVRQVGSIRLQIWQVMLLGALASLLTGQISPREALAAIDPEVMLFLSGVFLLGAALEESGYLSHAAYRWFRRSRTLDGLLLAVLLGAGFASALLMNDTLAIIGTPVVLLLARRHGMPPKVLLLALAFGVTIGGVMSPIGSPQNLLIALHGPVRNPFVTFLRGLAVPTFLALLEAFIVLRIWYRPHFTRASLSHSQEPIRDASLARIARIALLALVGLVAAKVILVALGRELPLVAIALLPAAIVLLSGRRLELLRRTDWRTLVFFASMFVLMAAVWQSGFLQAIGLLDEMRSAPAILAVSVTLSQLLSNVPLVALYLPALSAPTTAQLLALAAGSTLAGNLLIMGAASNVIIIQNAERRGESISFLEFAKVGVPLTILNVLTYLPFL